MNKTEQMIWAKEAADKAVNNWLKMQEGIVVEIAAENDEIKIGDIVTAKNSKIQRKVVLVESMAIVADRIDIKFASQANYRAWLKPSDVQLVQRAGA
jgi:hypothetical protein